MHLGSNSVLMHSLHVQGLVVLTLLYLPMLTLHCASYPGGASPIAVLLMFVLHLELSCALIA